MLLLAGSASPSLRSAVWISFSATCTRAENIDAEGIRKTKTVISEKSPHAAARYLTSRIVSCSLLTPNMYYPKNVLEPTRILLSRQVEFRILRLIPKSANTPQARGEGNDPLARRAQSGQSSTNPQRLFLCTLLNGGNSTAKRKTDERRKSLM